MSNYDYSKAATVVPAALYCAALAGALLMGIAIILVASICKV